MRTFELWDVEENAALVTVKADSFELWGRDGNTRVDFKVADTPVAVKVFFKTHSIAGERTVASYHFVGMSVGVRELDAKPGPIEVK